MTCYNLLQESLKSAIMDALAEKPALVTYDYPTMLKENYPGRQRLPGHD